jgi:hypothetical protein
MKQTAVEWLTEKLKIEFGLVFSNNILDEAKEMEKKQIVDAVNSQRQLGWDEKGEQYYNETYKNTEQ